MKTIKSLLGRFLPALLVCLCMSYQAAAETVVIVNLSSDVHKLSANEIKALFLGKSKQFKAFNQPVGSPIREEFMSKVMQKSEGQYKAYWSKKIFSGKGSPPKVLEDSAEVKRMVKRTPNAMGFIDNSLADDSVRVVYTLN